MKKLSLLLLPLLVIACNSRRDNDREDREEQDTVNVEDVETLFRCDTIRNSNKHQLSLLLSTYDEAIAIDTLTACDSVPESQFRLYQVPENIEGIAIGDDDVYYSTIKDRQLIIMKSPKGDNMNYEVHLSIPLEPVVKSDREE